MNNQNLFTKLNEIKKLAEECLESLSDTNIPKNKQTIKKEKKKGDITLLIVNKIKDLDEFEEIEKEVLDKSSIPKRVLLPFYICHKYFPQQGLTTGDVEKITEQLGVRVKTPNVSKAITGSLWKYLAGDSSRKRGKIVVYKLNRKGAKYFESVLKLKEIGK
ncbi:unnamed protein product [marine sediment metagenome]|uniref:Uncharacterized protein n=1 Tax=marine sediment metagenome TaxID=412755 RepID=X1N6U3_9ZZZZ